MSDTAAAELLEPLATRADVEALAGPELSLDPARVDRLLAMASAAVRNWTGQTISLVEDDAVIVISAGTNELVLAERPVIEVTEVAIEGRAPEAGFAWDAFGSLRRASGLPWGLRYDHVAVTYTHGWETVPDDVVGLVAAKVARFMAMGEANPSGLKALQVGAMSETYTNAAGTEGALGPGVLTKDEREALRLGGYRLGALAAGIAPP
jgi:hypothetical protein